MSCKNSEIVAASVIEASLKDPKIFNKIADWSGKINNAKKAVRFFSGKDEIMLKNAESILKDNQRQLNTFLFWVALKDRTQIFKVLEMVEKSSLPEKASIIRFMDNVDITNIEQSAFIRDVVWNITQDSIVKYKEAITNLSMNRFLESVDNQTPDFIENTIAKSDWVNSTIDNEDLLYRILDESNDYLALTDTISRSVKVITTSNEKEKIYTAIQKKFADIVNAEQWLKLTDDEISEVLDISDRLIEASRYVAWKIETNLAKWLELAIMAKYLDNAWFQLDKSWNTLKKAKFFNDSLIDQFTFYLQKKQEWLTEEGIEQAFKEKYVGDNYNKYWISTNLMTKWKVLATKPSDFSQNINHIFSMLWMSDNVLRSDAYVNSIFDYLETIKWSSQATEILNEIDNLKKTLLGWLTTDNKKAFLKDFSNKIDSFLKEKYASKWNISTDILQYVLWVGRIDDPTKAFFLDTYVESWELGNISWKLQDAGMYKIVVGGANYKLSSKDLEEAKKILADNQDRLNIKTDNPIISWILSGSIKDLFIWNATKKDFLWDLNKFIDKYNGVKDNAKVQIRYPSVTAQTYSLDFIDGQLVAKVDHPSDYNTLISRISFISNSDAIKQLKVMNPDISYNKLLQDKLTMEGYNASSVIDLLNNKYGENKLSIINNKLDVSQSVSWYWFQREIVNISDKRNELLNMKDFRNFLNDKIKETAKLFWLDTATDISGKGLISWNGFYIPKNRENLVNNVIDMLYSESITQKVDSLQKVMTEVGIFKSNVPYSISDEANKIDLFERTILNFDKRWYRVSTYERTDKALERVLNNSDKIQNWDDDVYKVVKWKPDIEKFLSGVIWKNLIATADQQSDAYKWILQTLVASMEDEILKWNIFATKNIGATFRIDASLQLLKDKAINMSKDDFLAYFSNIKKNYDDFMTNKFISKEENDLIKQVEKIEEAEQKLWKKRAGNKRVKIVDKEEKTAQSIAHSAKKERLLETIQQQYGIYDANWAVDKYDELVNASISIRTRKPEVDLARMEREPEEFYDNVNKLKSVEASPTLAKVDTAVNTSPLHEEARKYKSAEEFIDSKNPTKNTVLQSIKSRIDNNNAGYVWTFWDFTRGTPLESIYKDVSDLDIYVVDKNQLSNNTMGVYSIMWNKRLIKIPATKTAYNSLIDTLIEEWLHWLRDKRWRLDIDKWRLLQEIKKKDIAKFESDYSANIDEGIAKIWKKKIKDIYIDNLRRFNSTRTMLKQIREEANQTKTAPVQNEYRLAYLNDIDSAYNSIKSDLIEWEMLDNKPIDSIKDPEVYKKQMWNITLEYKQVANKLKADYESAKTVAEKADVIQKASWIKKTFVRKIDSLEQKFYRDYRGFTKWWDYISSKSNVILIDVTWDLWNINKGLDDINNTFSSKVDEINNSYKTRNNKQAVADRQAMDKMKMDSLFSKGYYVTSIDWKPNYVSVDNVIQDSMNSIPRWFSEDIDILRDIDLKTMWLQEKLQYLKIFKSAETYYDATRASKASVIRGKANPLLVDFDEVSKLVDVDINTSLLIDNLYSKTKLPTWISKQSQNFIDSFTNTAKEIGWNQLDHISDARGVDLFIKRKIFESVSNSLNKWEFTMEEFEKIYDKIISDIKAWKWWLLPSDVLSKMDYPEAYRQELRDVFYKYSQLPSFDISNLSQIDNRVTYNSEIISRLSPEDKQIIWQIRTKKWDSILSVFPNTPTKSENLVDELETTQPKPTMDVQEKAVTTTDDGVTSQSVDALIVEERQLTNNISQSIRTKYFSWWTALKTVLNKSAFWQWISYIVYDLTAPWWKIDMLLKQLFDQWTEVVQDCISLLKSYESNWYFVGMKVPDWKNNAETAAYFIWEYLNTLKNRMSTLWGIIDPDLQEWLDNIHKILLRVTSREDIKAIETSWIFSNVRIFEMARMANWNLRKSWKLKDIGWKLDDVTYKFFREQFGKWLSDWEVEKLYSGLVSTELSWFNKFFGNKRLTWAAKKSKQLAWFSAWWAITAWLQAIGRIQTAASDWIKNAGKWRKYKDVWDIMDTIKRWEAEWWDIRQLRKGEQTTNPWEWFIHVLNRDYAFSQAREENKYWFQQYADFTFRHWRKAESLNHAIWSVKKMTPEEFKRWLEVVPDSPMKTGTIDKIKSLASDIFVWIEGIGWWALNQVQEGWILGWYNRIYDFRWFRWQQMVKNIFNWFGTVGYSAKIYYDAIRKWEWHLWAMERLSKFRADNYESRIMLQDMYKNIYLTAKARNLRADEKNGKENWTVKDELKNFFTALWYTSPYFASFSSTSIGRTLGRLWNSYWVWWAAYDPNGKWPWYEAYSNFTKFTGEMFKEYKSLWKRSLYLIQAIKDWIKWDKDLETIMMEFWVDQSLWFQRYVTAEIVDATGREVMPKARGKNLGFLSDKDIDRMDVKYDQALYSNWLQRKKEDFPRASIVLKDWLAKLPIISQILSSQYANNKEIETYADYADKDPVYASFYKNWTIDFNAIKNNVGGNRAKMRDEIWNPLIWKSEGWQQFIWAGNAKEYLNAMQSAWVQNVYVESFLKSLGWEKAKELIYSLDFAKNNNDEKLKEAAAIINALAQKDWKTEEDAIWVYRWLLWYIAREYYDNKVAEVKDRNKKLFWKKEIWDWEKEYIKDSFITTVWTIIPKVDTQFGNEIMQDYIYYDPRTPEKVKQFYDKKSYKDNETGMELEDHYLTQKWKSALLTEYFTKKAAYNWDVNAYLEKNTFWNLTNALTPQEKVVVYLDTFKKLEWLWLSKDILIWLKWWVLGSNPDMIDAHADLEKSDPEMAKELKNDLYWTFHDAYDLWQAIMNGADADKWKSNSVSRSPNFSLEKSTDISKFINTVKSKWDDYLQFNETKNAKWNIRAAWNWIPNSRRKFIVDSAKMRDAISWKWTNATSKIYWWIANKWKSVWNNITKPKITKYKATKSRSTKSKTTG